MADGRRKITQGWTRCSCHHLAQEHDRQGSCERCGCMRYDGKFIEPENLIGDIRKIMSIDEPTKRMIISSEMPGKLNSRMIPQIDITAPRVGVEISVRADGKVVWINVDGVCALRVCQIPDLTINDERQHERGPKSISDSRHS